MTQYVYGRSVAGQLLRDEKPIREVLIQEGARNTALEGEIEKGRIPVRAPGRKKMDQLLNENHQDIAACIDDYKAQELGELLENVPQGRQPLLVMLGGLGDPHSLEAILRTCSCIRTDGVIIGKHHNARLTPTVAKVDIEAIDTVKINVATNLVQTIKYLKKQDYWVVGTDFENSRDYREGQYDIPLVLVISSEGFGISSPAKKNYDYCVRLPMGESVSSLNASITAGILLYQIRARRHPL